MIRSALCLTFVFLTSSAILAASDDFSVDLSLSTKTIKVNESTSLAITIQTKGHAHFNEQIGIKVRAQPPNGIKLEKSELEQNPPHSKDRSELKLEIKALEAGKQLIKGTIRFVLCSSEWCKLIDEPFEYAVVVTPQTNKGNAPGSISNLAGN